MPNSKISGDAEKNLLAGFSRSEAASSENWSEFSDSSHLLPTQERDPQKDFATARYSFFPVRWLQFLYKYTAYIKHLQPVFERFSALSASA